MDGFVTGGFAFGDLVFGGGLGGQAAPDAWSIVGTRVCSRPVAPLWRTADWGYLRLHTGAEGWGYRPETLQRWAERLAETYGGDDVLVYFNNDPGGAATVDAVTFADAVRAAGQKHTRVPTMAQASGAAWPPKPPPKARQRTAVSSAKVTPS